MFTTVASAPLNATSVAHRFQKQPTASGLPPMRVHDLRDATGSLLVAEGVDLRLIMTLLRQSQIALTASVYTHVSESVKRAAERAAERRASRAPSRPVTETASGDFSAHCLVLPDRSRARPSAQCRSRGACPLAGRGGSVSAFVSIPLLLASIQALAFEGIGTQDYPIGSCEMELAPRTPYGLSRPAYSQRSGQNPTLELFKKPPR